MTRELVLTAKCGVLQVLEKEEEGNELRRKLGELIRLVEQLQEANSEEAFDEVRNDNRSQHRASSIRGREL